jgi:hypothetical protein
MPEAMTAAAAVTAVKFPTTLLLLFFVTTVTQNTTGEAKRVQETKSVWTLQSTSEIQTPDPSVCADLANQMIAEFDIVNTVTVRAYCLCPVGDGKNICMNSQGAEAQANERRPLGGTAWRIGPDTPTHFFKPGRGKE